MGGDPMRAAVQCDDDGPLSPEQLYDRLNMPAHVAAVAVYAELTRGDGWKATEQDRYLVAEVIWAYLQARGAECQ
jgi:hypothetical protein